MSYPAINQDELLKIRIPKPNSIKQLEKIEMLSHERFGYYQLIGEVEKSVRLLIDYRNSIISAAVNGKFPSKTLRSTAS